MIKCDCIFYEEFRDNGARINFCAEKGASWDDLKGCRCDACRHYCPTDWLRHIAREIIKERKETNDPNKIV